jgi:hypothetical protein
MFSRLRDYLKTIFRRRLTQIRETDFEETPGEQKDPNLSLGNKTT